MTVGLQLSFMEPAPLKPAEVRTRREQWFDRVRPVIREHFAGRSITTDDVWTMLDARPDLAIPEGLSHNVLGSLFQHWDCAEGLGFTRSTRPLAKGNLLRVWAIR